MTEEATRPEEVVMSQRRTWMLGIGCLVVVVGVALVALAMWGLAGAGMPGKVVLSVHLDGPVVEVLDTVYGVFDNTMSPGKVVGRAWNVWRFAKHAFFKTDIVACRLARLKDESDATARVGAA